ncbi:hypothetical protein Acsp01_91240 [Actinoplanes sp. NBRC 101535]|nr:hypothetical protein Acsp01_91240 [Actinoplanes sp. NBRC 101535]
MFLSVHFRGERRYSESLDNSEAFVAEVIEEMRGEEEIAGSWDPGEDAWFCIADRRYIEGSSVAGGYLRVAINRRHEYGAIIWFVTQGFPRRVVFVTPFGCRIIRSLSTSILGLCRTLGIRSSMTGTVT